MTTCLQAFLLVLYGKMTELKKILVVDDEEPVREVLCRILEVNYEVVEAKDGNDAYQKYKEESIDLVITDMIMPGMNGSELFRKIRELNPDAKVYFISGYTGDEDIEQLINEGALGIIEKPFTPSEIREKVNEVLKDNYPA